MLTDEDSGAKRFIITIVCVLVLMGLSIPNSYNKVKAEPPEEPSWMEPGTRISYTYLGRNYSENSSLIVQSLYNVTVLENNETHFIVEERLTTGNISDWVQRRYDPRTRESLTFPGNHSWHWIDTNVSLSDPMPVGNVNFTVTGIIEQWPYKDINYTAIEVSYTEGNLTAKGYYAENTTLLLYSNVTITEVNYTVYMEYFYTSIEQLSEWPPPLSPPNGGGKSAASELESDESVQLNRQGWSYVSVPPFNDGWNIIDINEVLGLGINKVYAIWSNPTTGNLGSDMLSLAFPVVSRATLRAHGAMFSPRFQLPSAGVYKSWTYFYSDGYVSYLGLSDFYGFTAITVSIHYKHELVQLYPFKVIQEKWHTLYYRFNYGWWIFSTSDVSYWTNLYTPVTTDWYYVNPTGDYWMASRAYVYQQVVVSGPGFAYVNSWFNCDVSVMMIWKP